ncbi:nucleoside deaminase [Pelagicoccus albus]|uniref:Nucleoside deaminase n=1 Tax=Pelagicoccus albus TaxID=415222 RepID=A0A7X1B4U6_9BACT|nr:nucleoside deaminase [Pelagicoccus albus]MBC2605439.1 nucleoside deaminase [Pelagicoccus albus]
MTHEQMIAHLRSCNEIAMQAVKDGHHPFGAILIGPDDTEIILQQGNVDVVRHAESELSRAAHLKFEPDFLWQCTLVTTVEPCAMCAGTQYWANIGRLVFGIAETKLLELTGSDDRNPTLSVPSRSIMESGQKDIQVFGPFPELEDELAAPHKTFWA